MCDWHIPPSELGINPDISFLSRMMKTHTYVKKQEELALKQSTKKENSETYYERSQAEIDKLLNNNPCDVS